MNIVDNLRKGENQAFEKIYRDCYRMAQSYILNRNGNDTDVEYVFQEALFRLVKNIRRPDFQLTSSISTYLMGIIKNIWQDQLRKKKTRKIKIVPIDDQLNERLESTAEKDKAFEIEKTSKFELIQTILSKLKPEHREVISDFYYQSLSLKEMAIKRGITAEAMKVKKSRILKKIKDQVKKASLFALFLLLI